MTNMKHLRHNVKVPLTVVIVCIVIIGIREIMLQTSAIGLLKGNGAALSFLLDSSVLEGLAGVVGLIALIILIKRLVFDRSKA